MPRRRRARNGRRRCSTASTAGCKSATFSWPSKAAPSWWVGERSQAVTSTDLDLLFTLEENGRVIRKFVIDTKWKALEAKDGDSVSRSDLYQMYAYMAEYDCRRVVLLYPGLDDSYTHDGYILNKDRDRRVLVKTMPVSEDPRDDDTRQRLSAQLEEILVSGLDLV